MRAALLALVLLAGCARAPLVLLDPGHGPAQPGAIGVRGVAELAYNDAFAALLAQRLEAAGFRVALTRRPGEERSLEARAALAGQQGAWVLLAIHHDSAQPQFLAERTVDGRPAFQATRPLRGYALFVSGQNAHAEASCRLADALGRRLRALGRPPTLHHAEPIPGEGRELLDAELGVYRFDELKVLRLSPRPAVLLEVGVIVDPADDAYVTDPDRQAALAEAVVQGLRDVRGR